MENGCCRLAAGREESDVGDVGEGWSVESTFVGECFDVSVLEKESEE